eukprot:362814-Chlamydomonas_euryale.AAC.10
MDMVHNLPYKVPAGHAGSGGVGETGAHFGASHPSGQHFLTYIGQVAQQAPVHSHTRIHANCIAGLTHVVPRHSHNCPTVPDADRLESA